MIIILGRSFQFIVGFGGGWRERKKKDLRHSANRSIEARRRDIQLDLGFYSPRFIPLFYFWKRPRHLLEESRTTDRTSRTNPVVEVHLVVRRSISVDFLRRFYVWKPSSKQERFRPEFDCAPSSPPREWWSTLPPFHISAADLSALWLQYTRQR